RLPQNPSHPAAQVLAHGVPAEAGDLCKLLEAGSSRDVEVAEIPREAQDLPLPGCQPIVRADPAMANRFPTSQTPTHSKAFEEVEHPPAVGTRTPGGSRRTRCDRRTPRGRRLVARGPRRAPRSSLAGVAWLHVIIEILISRPCAHHGVGPWDRSCETCRTSRGRRALAPESWTRRSWGRTTATSCSWASRRWIPG